MEFREIMFLIGIGFFLLFIIILSIGITTRPKIQSQLENIVNGQVVMTKRNIKKDFQKELANSSLYQKRCANLQHKLNLIYSNNTPETIIKYQFIYLIAGLGITLLLHLILNVLIITLVSLGVTVYAVIMQEMDINSKIKAKEKGFDEALPQFETNMLLGMQAGAGIQKSMEMAIKSLPEGLIQIEFKKLLLESRTYTDDVALPYMNLSKRVPTKDCQRFCNIVISGIKNGNSMNEILTSESEYMTQQVLNRIKEQGERNSVKATAISTGLVFMPLLVIFLAPMMMSSGI